MTAVFEMEQARAKHKLLGDFVRRKAELAVEMFPNDARMVSIIREAGDSFSKYELKTAAELEGRRISATQLIHHWGQTRWSQDDMEREIEDLFGEIR
jgi:hypothetical protein